LRMKLNIAPRKGRDWARKLDSLSVPFRMKRWYMRWGVWRWDILSISLRMKPHSAKERNGAHSDFQFLWGWNTRYQRNWSWRLGNFQFLWGWNMVKYHPVGLEGASVYFQFLWGWNSELVRKRC